MELSSRAQDMKSFFENVSFEDLELDKKITRLSIEFRLRDSACQQTTQFS